MIGKIILIIGLIIAYVLVINIIAVAIPISVEYIETEKSSGSREEVGVGHSVQIQVEKNRFYGKILQDNENSNLLLFGFIPLPLKSRGHSFIKYHLIFFVLLLLIILLMYMKHIKKLYKGGNTKYIEY